VTRISSGAARVSRGARDLLARTRGIARTVASWRWTGPILRCVLAALGLVVLAAIGRSAIAGGASAPSVALATGPSAASPSATAIATTATPTPTAPAVAAESASHDAGPASSAPPARRATPDDPVFLNQAALDDLRRLPGVGPKRAQAILALRQRLGRFRQVEDLLKVKGIGRSTLKKLRPLVRVDTS
jgi:competence protein ComEA